MYANVVLSEFTLFFSRRCVSKSSNLTKARLYFGIVERWFIERRRVSFVTFDISKPRTIPVYIADLLNISGPILLARIVLTSAHIHFYRKGRPMLLLNLHAVPALLVVFVAAGVLGTTLGSESGVVYVSTLWSRTLCRGANFSKARTPRPLLLYADLVDWDAWNEHHGAHSSGRPGLSGLDSRCHRN